MTDQKKSHNKIKIASLHEQYLRNPPYPKDVAKAEREYLAVARKEREALATMARLVKQQRVQAAKKRKLAEKHEKLKAEMKAEQEASDAASAQTYAEIIKLSEGQKTLKQTLGCKAEALLLANGSGPVVLEGQGYDFGCYGERVYLVPRAKR